MLFLLLILKAAKLVKKITKYKQTAEDDVTQRDEEQQIDEGKKHLELVLGSPQRTFSLKATKNEKPGAKIFVMLCFKCQDITNNVIHSNRRFHEAWVGATFFW